MIYSSRLKKILHYCLSKHPESYVSLDNLADILKTSKRTIFRELKDVDKDLSDYGLRIDNKNGQGIMFVGLKEDKDSLLLEIANQGIEYRNKEERQNLLKFELLHSDELQKLLHYANLFQVSEATISNDLDIMESWFQEFHLQIKRTPGLGVKIQGEEQDVRRAMTALLNQSLQNDESIGSVNYLDSQTLLNEIFMKDDQGSIMRLLNQEIVERILTVFHSNQHELSLDYYAQSSYIGLIIHLSIAIDRILKKEEIEESEQVLAMIHDDISFTQAKKMAKCLETEFDIDIPEVEIAFIALHIKGAKITKVDYQTSENEDIRRMESLIQRMLQCFDQKLRIDLLQDEELFHGLLTHLVPTITRLKNHLPIYNPLLKQIKEMYEDLFIQCSHACELITHDYECNVSEDEVGFVTMHIGASLERMKQTFTPQRKVGIGIVCASGIGISALLTARMKKSFAFGIHLHILSMEEVLHEELKDCELLISTFSLPSMNIPVLLVSPLLNNDDIINIKVIIEQLRKQSNPSCIDEKSINFREELQKLQALSSNILEILQHFYVTQIDETLSVMDMIKSVAQVRGEEIEARKMIQLDLEKREAMGTTIMSDYHFALLHAKSEGIKHSSVDIYYPKTTHFTQDGLQNIEFVIILLAEAKKDIEKQEVLSIISRSFIEDEFFYKAILSRDMKQIEQQLSHIFRKHIKQIIY